MLLVQFCPLIHWCNINEYETGKKVRMIETDYLKLRIVFQVGRQLFCIQTFRRNIIELIVKNLFIVFALEIIQGGAENFFGPHPLSRIWTNGWTLALKKKFLNCTRNFLALSHICRFVDFICPHIFIYVPCVLQDIGNKG